MNAPTASLSWASFRASMIGARLQQPAGTKGKMPAVIMMHGTGGIKYTGVYYAAALDGTEGAPPKTRVAINQFDSMEAAKSWRRLSTV